MTQTSPPRCREIRDKVRVRSTCPCLGKNQLKQMNIACIVLLMNNETGYKNIIGSEYLLAII